MPLLGPSRQLQVPPFHSRHKDLVSQVGVRAAQLLSWIFNLADLDSVRSAPTTEFDYWQSAEHTMQRCLATLICFLAAAALLNSSCHARPFKPEGAGIVPPSNNNAAMIQAPQFTLASCRLTAAHPAARSFQSLQYTPPWLTPSPSWSALCTYMPFA